jgi:hypothetical protein
VQLSSTGRTGSANPMYGLPFWNFDMRVAKTTSITERFKLGFSADFFNVFNHQNFANPSLSITSPATFGVINSTFTPSNRTNAARWIEMGLRLDFCRIEENLMGPRMNTDAIWVHPWPVFLLTS